MRKILFLALAGWLCCLAAPAQKLSGGRKTSFYTYVFRITGDEARQIYRKNLGTVTDAFFHTVTDSFPTGKPYARPLPAGHYLFAFAEENRLVYELQSAGYVQVKLLGNKNDLAVHLHDSSGRLVPDARVAVAGKAVPFDSRTQSYRLRNAHRRGLLSVAYRGFTSYHVVTAKRQARRGVLALKKAAFGRPGLGYVTLPFYHAYASVRHWSPQGWVRAVTMPFYADWWHSTFDRSMIDDRRESRFRERQRGFVVFNKPRYRPSDTVRFKALLLGRRGRPVRRPVSVFLEGAGYPDWKSIRLATLNPYAPGGYEYAFPMHDSLQLKLGARYRIVLKNGRGREYIGGHFMPEDYELKANTFAIRSERKDYHRGGPPVLYAKGTDENGLNLFDARVRLTVLPDGVRAFTDPQVRVPDTLWRHEQTLDAVGETRITLPDSVFPNAEMNVRVQAVFLNAANEQHTRTLHFETHQTDELRLSLVRDSLVAELFRAGKPVSAQATLTAYSDYDNDVQGSRKTVRLPHREAASPYNNYYELTSGDMETSLDPGESPPDLQVSTDRTADSVRVQVANPRRLPFWYTLYRRNVRIGAGFGDGGWEWQRKATRRQNYFVSLQYVWNNQVREEEYQIPPPGRQLRIHTDQPATVQPGQTVPVRITVRDLRGRPVPGADVTAYSATGKFPELAPPDVPDLSRRYPGRVITGQFELDRKFDPERDGTRNSRRLQWERWHREMGLDSLAYFQFLYPRHGLYRHCLPMPNLMTQIAPFVVLDGRIEPIHTIFLDEEPIYFQVADAGQRYSFHADSGYHRLHLRTRTLGIRLDSVYLRRGEKLILSVDPAGKPPATGTLPRLTVQTLQPALSGAELDVLKQYLMPVRQNFGGGYTYLKQGRRVFYLNGGDRNTRPALLGPVRPAAAQFVMKDVFTTDFTFEPGFEYDFAAGLLKMRTWKGFEKHQWPLLTNRITPDFPARAWTAYELDSLQRAARDMPRYQTEEYNNPDQTTAPNGTCRIWRLELDGRPPARVRHLVLLGDRDPAFFRVYPAHAGTLHQLPAGRYRLVVLLQSGEYLAADSIQVGRNATTYLNLGFAAARPADAFSRKLAATAVEKVTMREVPPPPAAAPPAEPVRQKAAVENLWRDADFDTYVQGRVLDDGGAPLPGANVYVKGSARGTVTDADGFYGLYAPAKAVLVFFFIGYMTEERKPGSPLNVQLTPDIKSLQEVVVVGYGTQQRRDVTGSVSSQLQGRAAGVVVTTSGETITIRGASSLPPGKRPLLVVDGLVYDGPDLDPGLVASAEVLRGEAATALYGARGANGVIVITTRNRLPLRAGPENPEFAAQVSENQIRRRFSDYAYWQPRLRTGRDGTATFHAAFPDDITYWRTFVAASGSRRRTGVAEGGVKALKTLAAHLAVPRFLIQGDTAQAVGKALNYTRDTLRLQATFEVGGKVLSRTVAHVSGAHLDSATVVASGPDSLKISYVIQKADGYADGELRPVPVYAKGVLETKGYFAGLDKDTTFRLSFDPGYGPVTLHARADVLDILLDEIGHLHRYEHLCNEQAASKLKAYLSDKRIRAHLGQPFAYDKDVRRLISRLAAAQKQEGAWGWWQNSPTAVWVSVHVAEALLQAKAAGYAAPFDTRRFTDYFVFQVEKEKDFDEKLRMLGILQGLGAKVDYARHLRHLDSLLAPRKPVVLRNQLGHTRTVREPQPTLEDYINLLEMKQRLGMSAPLDTLWKHRQTTLFGHPYWGAAGYHPYRNEVQATLAVYRLLKAKGGHERELGGIRGYLLERRQPGQWRNTYESARILETILPDVLENGKTPRPAELVLHTAAGTQAVKQFPYTARISPDGGVAVRKTGGLPVYLTAYQQFQNPDPAPVEKELVVKTSFRGRNATGRQLKAGETVTLHVEVEVKKAADYLLVEVPIPAGCSYADAAPQGRVWGGHETYREPFRHKTAIYCTRLDRGSYSFDIQLVPRYTGRYTLNPAKAELMYFPTFFGRNETKAVRIK